MPDATDAHAAPPCPTCRAANTVFAFERFGVRTFMCPECEYSWDTPQQAASKTSLMPAGPLRGEPQES